MSPRKRQYHFSNKENAKAASRVSVQRRKGAGAGLFLLAEALEQQQQQRAHGHGLMEEQEQQEQHAAPSDAPPAGTGAGVDAEENESGVHSAADAPGVAPPRLAATPQHGAAAAGAAAAATAAAAAGAPADRLVAIEPLSEAAFAPFGAVLGSPFPSASPGPSDYASPSSDFWRASGFDPGAGGATEVLWVTYRDASLRAAALEAHWLTEQAVVPLAGASVVQLVCPTRQDDGGGGGGGGGSGGVVGPGGGGAPPPAGAPRRGVPDAARARAFLIPSGRGVCMRPGVWHASFAAGGGEATCLMLTRASTTADLVAHLRGGAALAESSVVRLASVGEGDIVVWPR